LPTTLPILLKHVRIPYENITIVDFEDKARELKAWTSRGIRFFQKRITPENLDPVLSEYLAPGGLLIDLAWNIDCCEIITWCHDHSVLYVNTSVEVWDSYGERFTASPYEKSLHHRQMRLSELTKDWKNAPTCVVDHGANPGLISHFARQGLLDIANRMIEDGVAPDPARMKTLVKELKFGEIAMETGIKVIHCSERDTQIDPIRAAHANMFLSDVFCDILAGAGGAKIELYETDGALGAAAAPGSRRHIFFI
jgi:homospermidine synthase